MEETWDRISSGGIALYSWRSFWVDGLREGGSGMNHSDLLYCSFELSVGGDEDMVGCAECCL